MGKWRVMIAMLAVIFASSVALADDGDIESCDDPVSSAPRWQDWDSGICDPGDSVPPVPALDDEAGTSDQRVAGIGCCASNIASTPTQSSLGMVGLAMLGVWRRLAARASPEASRQPRNPARESNSVLT